MIFPKDGMRNEENEKQDIVLLFHGNFVPVRGFNLARKLYEILYEIQNDFEEHYHVMTPLEYIAIWREQRECTKEGGNPRFDLVYPEIEQMENRALLVIR